MEFVFKPDQREVRWSSARRTPATQRSAALLKCVPHSGGKRAPGYPIGAPRRAAGPVLARLHFTAADQPPQVQVLARPASRPLARTIEAFVEGYRMPCFEGTEPVDATFTFIFTLEGAGPYGFKPTGPPDLPGPGARHTEAGSAVRHHSDGLPLRCALQYRQPYLPNGVGEVDSNDPARRPLLDWLATPHLDLPSRSLDAVFARPHRHHRALPQNRPQTQGDLMTIKIGINGFGRIGRMVFRAAVQNFPEHRDRRHQRPARARLPGLHAEVRQRARPLQGRHRGRRQHAHRQRQDDPPDRRTRPGGAEVGRRRRRHRGRGHRPVPDQGHLPEAHRRRRQEGHPERAEQGRHADVRLSASTTRATPARPSSATPAAPPTAWPRWPRC